tara:strand:+ start:148 stop:339 length:192 start_codon:yes stop_codon:yes gene_type:complete
MLLGLAEGYESPAKTLWRPYKTYKNFLKKTVGPWQTYSKTMKKQQRPFEGLNAKGLQPPPTGD